MVGSGSNMWDDSVKKWPPNQKKWDFLFAGSPTFATFTSLF